MKSLRYGVVGLKGAGKSHIRAAQANPNIDLVALVDNDSRLLEEKSKELRIQGYTNYCDLLEGDKVDAVSIATPHYLHCPMGSEFLAAGIHIYVEKPLANTLSEANRMIELAQKHQLKIAVGHQYRTHRTSQILKHLIETGTIGNLLRILWTWGQFRPDYYYTRDAWRGQVQGAGGGILMSHVSHDLDLICWLLGQPVQVQAFMANQLHNTQVEDIACAQFVFRNGALGSFQGTINQPNAYSVRQFVGTKGMIVMPNVKSLVHDLVDEIRVGRFEDNLLSAAKNSRDPHYEPKITWERYPIPGEPSPQETLSIPQRLLRKMGKTNPSNAQKPVKPPNSFSVLMNSFVDAILHDGTPLVDGESARLTLEVINGMILSAVRKKVVDFPIDPEEYDQLYQELCNGKLQIPHFRPTHENLISCKT
jgi:UDP-N-acetyl-2-amino-2-deoxyglucuronate dehydrogenase